MGIGIHLTAIWGAFFPDGEARRQNNKQNLQYDQDTEKVKRVTEEALKPATEEEIHLLDTILCLGLLNSRANVLIQSQSIMDTEDRAMESLTIAKKYIKAIVDLRNKYSQFFPEWTDMVRKGEIPKEFLE